MNYLTGEEEKEALKMIEKAGKIAKKATCERAKCAAIIVKSSEIIGEGFNSPPGNSEKQRRCSYSKDFYHKKVTDKTCCIHAEQRAIMDALKKNPEKLSGSRLYFIRLDENGEPQRATSPYCTICSKMVLDVGVSEFVLWNQKGVAVYDTAEYDTISANFSEEDINK